MWCALRRSTDLLRAHPKDYFCFDNYPGAKAVHGRYFQFRYIYNVLASCWAMTRGRSEWVCHEHARAAGHHNARHYCKTGLSTRYCSLRR